MKGRVWRRPKPDGSLYDAWSVVIDVGTDPKSGKRKQLTKSNAFKSEREAWRYIRTTLSEMDRGEFIAPSPLTLGEYLSEWLPTIQPHVKPSTYLSYQSITRRQIIPCSARSRSRS